ncbi:MAG: polysaccharide biosynthesis C-terminal domain-containing protein [Bacteroidales bacterium]|jgi:O-antigen/teichoic acid export membrane protein|nr:polysaccharide biosynthesis C-terminal domain-containing protein [Bacteroidales bacterium]
MSKLLKNTLIYSVGRIIPQLSGFVLLPMYTSYLLPSEYGIVQSMQILTVVLCIFFSLASERSIFRLYYDYKELHDQKKFIGNITLIVTVVSVTLLLLLLFPLKGLLQNVYQTINFYPFYFYALLNTFFLSFSYIPNNLFQVRGEALKFTIFSLVTFFLGVIFIIFFVVFKEEGASGMLKGQMIGNGIMFFVYLPLIYKQSIFKIDLKVIKNIFHFSLPMIPALLSAWILNMSNRILIEKLTSNPENALYEIGIFSLAFKIASVSTLLLGAISTAYNPVFYEYANQHDQTVAKKKLEQINYIFAFVSFFVCFSIALFSRELIHVFFNTNYYKAIELLPILLLSAFIAQITGVFNLMIYQNKKTIALMLMMLVSAIISIFLNFVFIPKWGSLGAAWATVCGVILNIIMVILYAKKNYYISFSFFKIGSLFISAIIIIWVEHNIDYNNIIVSILLKLLLLSVILFVFLKKNKEILFIITKGRIGKK